MKHRYTGQPRPLHALFGLLFVATGALLLIAGCSSSPPAPAQKKDTPTAAAAMPSVNSFVGNAACAECHADIVKTHAQARHANTLRSMDQQSLGKMAPPEGPVPKMIYSIAKIGDQFGLTSPQQPKASFPMQLAFGSGKTGMTYVAVLSMTRLAEMRMSYFPHTGTWYVTPGQEKLKDQRMGKLHEGDFPLRCVLCHAVTVPSNTLVPEKKFMGVGCESCHGQGAMHIAGMRAGKQDALYLEPLKKVNGTRINEICGQCHMTTQHIVEMNLPKDATQRFQPYGLAQSKCFTQSNGKLTCITCHDPHTDASKDTRKYETICLSCHGTSVSPGASGTTVPHSASTVPGKSCPVNAKSGCIGCHMPERKVFAETDIPTMMPDHFIRVFRKEARKAD